jgi:hypothetical protein
MPSFRTRWRVVVDGVDGPIYVTTNARDQADVVIPLDRKGSPEFSMGLQNRIVHNALLRTEAPVPRDFVTFLDALVEADEVDDETGGRDLDPTQLEVSAG